MRLLLITICLVLFLAGCTVQRAANGIPGVDTSSLRTGASREDVEKLLGPPLQEWQSIQGVKFGLYEFAGPSDTATDTTFYLLMDVISLGFVEVIQSLPAAGEPVLTRTKIRMIISFDANGRVLGRFGEHDQLPPDGKPLKSN